MPDGSPRALPSPSVGTAISRESGRHQDFGLPAKAIAGPDLATGWRNSRSRTAKPSSTRRAQTIRRKGRPQIARWWGSIFRLLPSGEPSFRSAVGENIIAPVLRGGSAGFPAQAHASLAVGCNPARAAVSKGSAVWCRCDDHRRGAGEELLQKRVVGFIHHRVAIQHIQYRIAGGGRGFVRHCGPYPVVTFAIGGESYWRCVKW